jgi:NADPH:quinone reductase-like Zn-dependent oxidoreductase
MKAIQFNAYGNSSVLELKQIDKPSYLEDEVLVRIAATTVNPFDMKVRDGKMQKMIPMRFPSVPGSDVAGVVEAKGDKVKELNIGDEVFATTFGGTYAEYIALKEFQVAIKPRNVSWNEAASLAVPLVTTYTLLIETAQMKAGQKILVHGASGAIGSAVVQMAKSLGAYVIGTATGNGVSYLKSIGADEIVDYKTQDFSMLVNDVDLVADLVGGETQAKSFSLV